MPGTPALARFPLTLLAVLVLVFIPTFLFTPEGRLNWSLEVGPGILGMAALAIAFPKFPMTRLVYLGVFIHVLILVYGGFYSYAKAPLGDWAMHTFGFHRNHYDRIGHLALGFFPALTIREILLRVTPLRRGGWLTFLVLSVVLAIGAFWELIEWWTALILDPAGGDKFLGSQGDIWDAQWDMFLALVGASISLPVLGRAHDRAMEKLLGAKVE